jgi:transposase
VIAEREFFEKRMQMWPADKLVFIDESGVNLALTRAQAWGPRGERVVDHVPAGTWQTYSVIAGLRRGKGVIAPMLLRGAMDTAAMRVWARDVFAPLLKRGDIVIMDNLGIHNDPEVIDAIRARGARVEFLPRYSPDLNPIEPAWGKMKSMLRAAKARVFETLVWAVDEALSAITPKDCRGWFQHAGYAAT